MTTAQGAAPHLREARLEDYDQIVALEAAQNLRARSREAWSSLWTANPLYQKHAASWPIGWVLEEKGGRIVGTIGNIPLPYVFQGRPLLVAAGRGWAVDERYRSFALMLMDQYFDQENVDIFLNTTVNSLAAEAFSVFGSLPVPVGDWSAASYWITGYAGFARTALRVKNLPLPEILCYPAAVALYGRDLLSAKSLPDTSGVIVRREESFDHRFDAFWQAIEKQSQVLLGVRSREILDWHFGAALRQGEIWLLTIPARDALAAYAIFQRRDEPKTGLRRMRLVDFQTLDPTAGHLQALLDQALRLARRTGIHAVEKIGREIEATSLIDRYAPYTRRLPTWPAYFHAPAPDLQEALQEPSHWSPSTFDGDASL